MSGRSYFIILLVLFVSACSGGSSYVVPVINYGQSSGAGSAGVHNVTRGDTLYTISQNYRLPMRDIAVLNRLQPPFVLNEGQRLRLPPPQEYTVQEGDTLYGVSRLFGVDSSEIVELNNLRAPYVLRVGNVLRMPSLTRKSNAIASNEEPPVKVKPPATIEKSALPSPSQNLIKTEPLTQPTPTPKPPIVQNGIPQPGMKPLAPSKPESFHVSKVNAKTPARASSKFLRPVRGKIISDFGPKKNGLHNDGINIEASRGSPVQAAENGVVVYAGNALKGSGNLVLLRHDDQWMTAYGHLDNIQVREGEVLKRGAKLGTVGSTGAVSSPQLHFEIRRGTSAINPNKYLE
ncbi:MAG: peptidoglycan DD-metalloendopeptidase family protein [Alphaproteobacteria bacterium]|nr:peptidoglycan DD-metalloendopeptidase family protein [Alphaproteobacteria bacterium]